MTRCGACGARGTLFLCERDISKLDEMLEQLAWLMEELETTRCRMDRLTVGNTRRSAETLSPINHGAMEAAREADKTVTWILGQAGALDAGAIARNKQAGEMYRAVAELAGDPDRPDSNPGRLILIINRQDRVFGGLCPTTIGRDHQGRVIECGVALYGISGQRLVSCPRCQYEVDIEKNRARSATDRDLMTESRLLELLVDLGEPVSRVRFYGWLKDGKVVVRGFIHQGQVVPNRIRRGDPRVFSISQIRSLRIQETMKV